MNEEPEFPPTLETFFQGVLAGAGWKEGKEEERKDLKRVAWAS